MEKVFFDSWTEFLRTGITAVLFYLFIILAIKVMGEALYLQDEQLRLGRYGGDRGYGGIDDPEPGRHAA